ncbi:hypothetical protein [uncultured Parabacteroides sp.]|uniref:hypothetical protein n=1 Tax=uncultured Parabacteroides sp. TaxID=512312 RepID=UPI0025F76519|nr:hypothetical protein [uncultured Parabacteroides sp.]
MPVFSGSDLAHSFGKAFRLPFSFTFGEALYSPFQFGGVDRVVLDVDVFFAQHDGQKTVEHIEVSYFGIFNRFTFSLQRSPGDVEHLRGLFCVCLRPSQGKGNIQYTLVLLILNPAACSPVAG